MPFTHEESFLAPEMLGCSPGSEDALIDRLGRVIARSGVLEDPRFVADLQPTLTEYITSRREKGFALDVLRSVRDDVLYRLVLGRASAGRSETTEEEAARVRERRSFHRVWLAEALGRAAGAGDHRAAAIEGLILLVQLEREEGSTAGRYAAVTELRSCLTGSLRVATELRELGRDVSEGLEDRREVLRRLRCSESGEVVRLELTKPKAEIMNKLCANARRKHGRQKPPKITERSWKDLRAALEKVRPGLTDELIEKASVESDERGRAASYRLELIVDPTQLEIIERPGGRPASICRT